MKREETYWELHGSVFSKKCSGLLLHIPRPLEEPGPTGHLTAEWDRYSVMLSHIGHVPTGTLWPDSRSCQGPGEI